MPQQKVSIFSKQKKDDFRASIKDVITQFYEIDINHEVGYFLPIDLLDTFISEVISIVIKGVYFVADTNLSGTIEGVLANHSNNFRTHTVALELASTISKTSAEEKVPYILLMPFKKYFESDIVGWAMMAVHGISIKKKLIDRFTASFVDRLESPPSHTIVEGLDVFLFTTLGGHMSPSYQVVSTQVADKIVDNYLS